MANRNPDFIDIDYDCEGIAPYLLEHYEEQGDDIKDVIVLEMLAYRHGEAFPVNSLAQISFFKRDKDWKTGRFTHVSHLEGCKHLQEIARDMGLPE